MDSTGHWFKSQLREMPRTECLELLASRQVGRIAFTDPAGPIALPVNYTMHDDCVLFATSRSGSLARHAIGQVAFEVDDADEFNESGWSVLVRGSASVVSPEEIPAEKDQPDPWPGGPRTLLLQIIPQGITGRRLFPA